MTKKEELKAKIQALVGITGKHDFSDRGAYKDKCNQCGVPIVWEERKDVTPFSVIKEGDTPGSLAESTIHKEIDKDCPEFTPKTVQLADVLLAIEKAKGEDAWEFAIDSLGRFMRDWGENRHETIAEEWDLTQPYDNQPEEVYEFLHNILID